MLAEFLEALAKRIETAQQTRILTNPFSPGGKDGWLLEPGKQAAPFEYGWREDHVVHTVHDLIHAVNANGSANATVWHSPEFVIGLLDGTRRGGRVVFKLEPTTQLALLEKFSEGMPTVDHRTFLRTLRHELAGCNLELLRDLIKRVEFTSGSKTVSEQRTNRGDTLGRSVDHAVVAGGDVPEEVVAITPLWNGLQYREAVACTVEIDIQNGRFGLWPKPGELELAILRGQAALRELLEAELDSADVFCGRPDFV